MSSRSVCSAAFVFGALCLHLDHARADPLVAYRWMNPAGGMFHDAVNWAPQGVPNGSDAVIFDLASPYTVSLGENANVNSLSSRFGDVTLDLQGRTFRMFGAGGTFQVGDLPGDNAAMTIQNGTFLAFGAGVSDNGSTVINRPAGRLAVRGSNTSFVATGDMGIGTTGVGTLSILEGASVGGAQGGPVVFGWYAGSFGSGFVSGAGTTFGPRDLYVGQSGRGRLLIENGARLNTTRVISIALTSGADGQVVLRGAGTRWVHTLEFNTQFIVGEAGPGALGVFDGARIDSNDTVRIRPLGTLVGNAAIGANVQVLGKFAPGGGYDEVTQQIITTGIGRMNIDGTYLQSAPGGLLDIELGGRLLSEYDQVLVSGTATLGGTFRLNLISGFSPSFGDSFTVLNCSQRLGQFDNLQFPPLPNGWSFAMAYGASSVTVSVIPSPGPGAIACMGLLATCLSRRRVRQQGTVRG